MERAQCGMKIGWGEGYEHFNGCIDDVRGVMKIMLITFSEFILLFQAHQHTKK